MYQAFVKAECHETVAYIKKKYPYALHESFPIREPMLPSWEWI